MRSHRLVLSVQGVAFDNRPVQTNGFTQLQVDIPDLPNDEADQLREELKRASATIDRLNLEVAHYRCQSRPWWQKVIGVGGLGS